MIRNVPHISSTSKLTLQSCLTLNNVFQHPHNNANNNINHIKQHKKFHYSAKAFNLNTQNQSNTKIPSLKELSKNVPKHSLPYYHQLLAFDECLTNNSFFDPKTGKILGNNTSKFWNSIEKIIPLYNELLITGELNEKRMDEMISLLRNGLRMHRFELSKLRKNFDKDVNSPLQKMNYNLKESILKISNDIVNPNNLDLNLIAVSTKGLTNLFKAFQDMKMINEATEIWNNGKKQPKLFKLFTSESVLGSVFTLLIENNEFEFNEIWAIYLRIKNSKTKNEIIHSELQVSMIKACLLKNKTENALEIFNEITTNVFNYYKQKKVNPPFAIKNYMSMAHLSFIGYCQDFETANVFFKNSFKNEMPYLTPIQINYIKKFMENTWNNTKDYEKVKNIWILTWEYFEQNNKSTSAISSSLNDSFLEIFFKKFDKFDSNSANELKNLLQIYSEIKKIDEPFFNCLLTKSKIWENADVFNSMIKAGDLYNFPKTNVYYRCALKTSGSVNLPIDETFNLFNQLLSSNVKLGSNAITNADWFALRDATIHSKKFLTGNKIDLYFKLFKICCPYFLNFKNFRLYMNLDNGLDSRYNRIFEEIDRIDVSDIHLSQLEFFNRNEQIENYFSQRNISI